MSTLERLKVLYKERYLEHHDMDRWNEEIEREWPKLLAYIEKLEAAVDQIEVYGNAPLATEWNILKWRYLEVRKAKAEL